MPPGGQGHDKRVASLIVRPDLRALLPAADRKDRDLTTGGEIDSGPTPHVAVEGSGTDRIAPQDLALVLFRGRPATNHVSG
jgi:hypothetical protein